MTKKELEQKKRRARVVVRELKKLFPNAEMMLRHKTSWQLLVAVVLSAQTTDKQVNKVTKGLFKKYRTLDDYVGADLLSFQEDIKSIGLFRGKAKNILASAKIVKNNYGGRIPKTMDHITKLPGVGRKTANVVLGNVYGVIEGIAVDTHVRRLSKLFGLTEHIDPKKIELDLMKILPKKEWFLFTYRMIEYGRVYSPARKKDHTDDYVLRKLFRLK